MGLTSRAAVCVTLCSFPTGGSQHCFAERKLLLFLQKDRFSLCGGFLWSTAPSGLTFIFRCYVREALKRLFIKMQAWVLHTARDKAHFYSEFSVRFSSDMFIPRLKRENYCGVASPRHLQAEYSCRIQKAEKIEVVPQGPLVYLLYLSLEMRHLWKGAGLKRMPLWKYEEKLAVFSSAVL